MAHTIPFAGSAVFLMLLQPLVFPVAFILLAHAWIIPELYAQRGANVVRPRHRTEAEAERTALGLLGDLVDHDARELHAETGLVLDTGRLGTWLVGEAGALLLPEGQGQVFCWCVGVPGPGAALGRPDRAPPARAPDRRGRVRDGRQPRLRGRPWRVRRRLRSPMRPALDRARAIRRSATSGPRILRAWPPNSRDPRERGPVA